MGIKESFAYQVEVFTLKDRPVANNEIAIKFCFVDKLADFEVDISTLGARSIRSKLRMNEAELIKAMQCQYKAAFYGIKKFPAIVIDKRFVAYGINSIEEALSLLKRHEDPHA